MQFAPNTGGTARKYHYATLTRNAPAGTLLVAPNGINIQESDLFVSKTDPRRQVVLFTTKEETKYEMVKDLVPNAYITQVKGPFVADDMRMYSYLRGTYIEKRDMIHTVGVARPSHWPGHPVHTVVGTQVSTPPVVGTKFGIDDDGKQYVVGPVYADSKPDTDDDGPDMKRNRVE